LTLNAKCAVSENIYNSLTEGIFSKNPPPPNPLEIPIKLDVLVVENPQPPRKFLSILWREYGYFLELRNVGTYNFFDKGCPTERKRYATYRLVLWVMIVYHCLKEVHGVPARRKRKHEHTCLYFFLLSR